MKAKENWKNKYEMMNAELRNCRRVLTFLKKEIKDTKGEGDQEENAWRTAQQF